MSLSEEQIQIESPKKIIDHSIEESSYSINSICLLIKESS